MRYNQKKHKVLCLQGSKGTIQSLTLISLARGVKNNHGPITKKLQKNTFPTF